MDIFKGQNLPEFSDWFKTDEDFEKYLAEIKWKAGFKCLKCRHKRSQMRRNYSRTYNIRSHQESAISNILSHKIMFGVRKTFFITFEMGTNTKSLCTSYMGVR